MQDCCALVPFPTDSVLVFVFRFLQTFLAPLQAHTDPGTHTESCTCIWDVPHEGMDNGSVDGYGLCNGNSKGCPITTLYEGVFVGGRMGVQVYECICVNAGRR